jgi:Zn-dependent peptidase ImmA (M78 family)
MKMNAQKILDMYWDGYLPVDVLTIAKKMGFRLIDTVDEATLSGYIELKEGVPFCSYNSKEPMTRQRFTIAHEVGHYALGHLDDDRKFAGGKRMFRDTSSNFQLGQNREETQANQFAAELLMPAKVVDWLIKEKDVITIEALSENFNVSTTAMVYRLKKLGWIKG